MATCSADKTIKLWNYDKGGYVLDKTLYGHSKWVNMLVYLANGNLASASGDTSVKVWDINELTVNSDPCDLFIT